MGHCRNFNNVEMVEDRLGQYCDPPIINHEFSPWNDFLLAFNHLDVFHLPQISRIIAKKFTSNNRQHGGCYRAFKLDKTLHLATKGGEHGT